MDWQKLWSRSAICVHDETMSCFVAQTMGCSVGGQIEGLICSQTFEENLLAFWAVLEFKRLAVFWEFNYSMGDAK
jgi:hypothetical protein